MFCKQVLLDGIKNVEIRGGRIATNISQDIADRYHLANLDV